MSVIRPWQFSLLIVLTVLGIFFPVYDFDFLYFDDRLNVLGNPLIRDFSMSSFLRFWSQPFEGLYIPLTYTLWGVLATVAGGTPLSPAPFHIANLLLHTATVVALFFLFRLLVKEDWAAALGALFFGLHPLVVEPVAWITELKGVLSGCLAVLSLRLYLVYGENVGKTDWRPTDRNYLLATLLFVAALLAKPSALVLPMLAWLLGYFSQSRRGKFLFLELLPWLVLTLPVAIVTKYAQPDSQLPFRPDLWERVLVAGNAMGFYFLKFFWPFNLAPDYGHIPSVVLASKARYLTGLLPWLLLCTVLIKKVRPWLVVIGIPFCSLLPVLGFIPFTFQGTSTVADRYVYLGLIGPSLGVAMLMARYRSKVVWLGVLASLVGSAMVSSIQLRHWQDPPTLKSHIHKVNPNSWIAHHNLGMYFKDQNRLGEAEEQYREAIRHKPSFYLSYFNLGNLLHQSNDLDGAVEHYEKAVKIKPDFIPAHNNLGAVYLKKGLTAKAIKAFEDSVAVKPDFPEGHRALGHLYALMDRKEESIAAYRKAIALKPTAEAFNELGLVCLDLGRHDEAEFAFGKAADLGYDPVENLARLEEARRTRQTE